MTIAPIAPRLHVVTSRPIRREAGAPGGWLAGISQEATQAGWTVAVTALPNQVGQLTETMIDALRRPCDVLILATTPSIGAELVGIAEAAAHAERCVVVEPDGGGLTAFLAATGRIAERVPAGDLSLARATGVPIATPVPRRAPGPGWVAPRPPLRCGDLHPTEIPTLVAANWSGMGRCTPSDYGLARLAATALSRRAAGLPDHPYSTTSLLAGVSYGLTDPTFLRDHTAALVAALHPAVAPDRACAERYPDLRRMLMTAVCRVGPDTMWRDPATATALATLLTTLSEEAGGVPAGLDAGMGREIRSRYGRVLPDGLGSYAAGVLVEAACRTRAVPDLPVVLAEHPVLRGTEAWLEATRDTRSDALDAVARGARGTGFPAAETDLGYHDRVRLGAPRSAALAAWPPLLASALGGDLPLPDPRALGGASWDNLMGSPAGLLLLQRAAGSLPNALQWLLEQPDGPSVGTLRRHTAQRAVTSVIAMAPPTSPEEVADWVRFLSTAAWTDNLAAPTLLGISRWPTVPAAIGRHLTALPGLSLRPGIEACVALVGATPADAVEVRAAFIATAERMTQHLTYWGGVDREFDALTARRLTADERQALEPQRQFGEPRIGRYGR